MPKTKLNLIFLFGFIIWLIICPPCQARSTTPDDPLIISPEELNKSSSIFLKKQLKQIVLNIHQTPLKVIKSNYTLKKGKFTNSLEDDYLVIGKINVDRSKLNTKVVSILRLEDGVYKEVFRWIGWNKGFNAKVRVIDLNETDGVTELAIESDGTGGQSLELVVEIYKYLDGKFACIWSATLEESWGGCSYKQYKNHYQLVDGGAAFKEIELEIHYKEDSTNPPYELVKDLKHVNRYYWNGAKYIPKGHEFSYRYAMEGPNKCKDLP